MKYLLKKVLVLVLAMALMVGLIPAGCLNAAGGIEDYAEKLLKQNKGLIELRLDDKNLKGYQLFYNKGGSFQYTSLKESGFVKCEESKDYPGYYIVDISEMDADSGYIPYGRFLLYEKKATEVGEMITEFDYDDVCFKESNLQTLDFYTISFEQGDIEVPELPYSYIHLKGKFDYWSLNGKMPENTPGYIDALSFNTYGNMEAGGYCFAWYADKNGTKSENLQVTAPVTLHPVFVNEQKVTSATQYDYSGSNLYGNWYYDSEASDNKAEQIRIKNGKELITALTDKKSNFLLINSEVKLDKATAKKELDSIGKYYSEFGNTLRFGIHENEKSDFIIIEKGGSLTFDGIHAVCDVNWEPNQYEEVLITVQDGGKLYFKNYSEMEYGVLSVQPKGEVVVDDTSCLDVNVLYNYGTITFAAPKKLDNSRYDYLRAMNINDTFFNASSGTININYREVEFKYSHCWSVGGTYSGDKNRVGDLHECRLRNNGTINLKGNSRIEFGAGSGSVYQWDRVAAMPFVNNGTIKVDNDPTDSTGGHFFGNYSVVLSYSSFVNNGTIDITSTYGKNPVSETGSFYAYGGGWSVYDGELINNGTINITVKRGIGLLVSGLFYDPSGSGGLSHTSVTEIQKGRINNKKGAVINVKSGKNSTGIALGDQVELNNEGTINLNFSNSKEKTCNYPLLISTQYDTERNPVVNNKGTIKNNAYIGYANKSTVKWNGKKATGKGKAGNITGSKDTLKVPATSIKKVTGAKGSMKITWAKQKKKVEGRNIWGYEIQYSTDKTFESYENSGILSVYGFGTTAYTVKDLAKGTYYVRIRVMYKDGSTTYSDYSKVKTVKVK